MIPNDRAFNGKASYEFDGKTFFRWYYIKNTGDYFLRIKIISTDSVNKQGITLNFSDFIGSISCNGIQLDVPKRKFSHYLFKEGDTPNNEFNLSVHVEQGCLFLGNASERREIGMFTSGSLGNAFWIEKLSPTRSRFYCNDHEYDDDFDDLIFEIEIINKL